MIVQRKTVPQTTNRFLAAIVEAYQQTGLIPWASVFDRETIVHNPLEALIYRGAWEGDLKRMVESTFPNAEWREGFLEGWEGPYRHEGHTRAWEAGYRLGVEAHLKLVKPLIAQWNKKYQDNLE